MRWLLSFLPLLPAGALAMRFGEQCDATPMYSATWQYDDSCRNVYLFCDPASNTCNYKGCSNSDYVKGWDVRVHPFPQRCASGSYCPDDSSQCRSLVSPGGACELQRDDECAGPAPICLNATCYVKAAPLGGRCASDITEYVSYDARGYALRQRIVRDNCIQDTYCDEGNSVCIPSKANGAACDQDRECVSQTCASSGICVNGPDVFHTIPTWLWAILALAVCLFILLILGVLWLLHRYQSKKERAKVVKFFGDNEEFAKYAMLEEDDAAAPRDQRTSMVFLTHPEMNTSMALSTTRPLSFFRSSDASSPSRLRTPPPRPSPESITPSGGSRSSMPRGSATDLHTSPFDPDHRRSNPL